MTTSNDSISDHSAQFPASSTGKTDPQLSNTGVRTQYSVDWLRYTVSRSVGQENALPPDDLFTPTGETLRPFKNYNLAAGLDVGRLDWNDTRPTQGIMVTLDGQALTELRRVSYDLQGLLNYALYVVDGNITRLDFAVDVFGADASPMDVKTCWENGIVQCAADTCGDVGTVGKGAKDLGRTVYLGARSSDRVVRVYDKAKREGIEGISWVRIEGEFKGAWAVAVAKSMAVAGVIPAGKAALRAFLPFSGVRWLDDALAGDDGEYLEPVERKLTDRQRWYRDQVGPALEQDLRTDGGWLRGLVQGLLDETEESAGHGGVVAPVVKGNKWKRALKVLDSYGFEGGIFRLAFRYKGPDFTYAVLELLGYSWDRGSETWEKVSGQ